MIRNPIFDTSSGYATHMITTVKKGTEAIIAPDFSLNQDGDAEVLSFVHHKSDADVTYGAGVHVPHEYVCRGRRYELKVVTDNAARTPLSPQPNPPFLRINEGLINDPGVWASDPFIELQSNQDF